MATASIINTKHQLVSFTIQGVTPLLMSAFYDSAAMDSDKGSSSSIRSGDKGSPREQALLKLHVNSNGQVIIPADMIFACIISAGVFHKVGKTKVTTAKTSLIPAGVSIMEIESLLKDKDGNVYTADCKGKAIWEVDSRPVVNPNTGGRFMCHRPKFITWQVTFSMDVDTRIFNVALVRDFIDDAGLKLGLGDFRPQKKGPFGKFKVIKWDVSAVLSQAA